MREKKIYEIDLSTPLIHRVEGLLDIALGLYLKNKKLEELCEIIQSNTKSVILFGGYGSGKSLIMDCLSRVIAPEEPYKFYIDSSKRIVEQEFNINGDSFIYLIKGKNMAFDDLGDEPLGYRYGERRNVFESIFKIRYDEWVVSNIKSHGTTNLSQESFEAYYGAKNKSRFRQTHHFINWTTLIDLREHDNFNGFPSIKFTTKLSENEKQLIERYKRG